MKHSYFSEMMDSLATRASQGTVSWLGFANVPLRQHLQEVFSSAYGSGGSYLADPAFESVFDWMPSDRTMADLAGDLLSPQLVDAMNNIAPDLSDDYRFPSDRRPYQHQLMTWRHLLEPQAKSVVVASGTGSGKTECFMVPILDQLAREQASVDPPLIGVRALFLYPLNALINSQRDRLRAWTHAFGNRVRFCLYNGTTPERFPAGSSLQVPNWVQDRRTLRALPPPLLVTNPTMLEYMLVRTQDANILAASQGKLRWIVLDEAHTYLGSRAAELALLLRRVMHAFGVRSEDVRFIATSATIGRSDAEGMSRLEEFISRLSGVDRSSVHVVTGSRQVPQLPSTGVVTDRSLEEIWSLDTPPAGAASRYDALCESPRARRIRDLFTGSGTPGVASLTDVCRVVHGSTETYTRDQQDEALRWLDLLTDTVDANKSPFLPLRGHLFHQTLSGLWCCADPDCPEKNRSKLDHPGWPFGQLFLVPRNHCDCRAPVYELVACRECGTIFLSAEVDATGRITQASADAALDEFELDSDDDIDETGNLEEMRQQGPSSLLLLANHAFPSTEVLYIDRQSRRIVEGASSETVRIRAWEDGGDGLSCPACETKSGSLEGGFRTANIGAPFLLGGLLPTLLEFAPDGDEPADRPYRGRKLLTFSDTRQGTARLAARLQQDAERTKIRGLIYHHILARSADRKSLEHQELTEELQELEAILADTIAASPRRTLTGLIAAKRKRLESLNKDTSVSFQDLRAAIAQEGHEFRRILFTFQQYSSGLFGGNAGASTLAGLLIVRELGRRPRRQNNLETMGMVSVRYPALKGIKAVPTDWTRRHYSLDEWRDFLKIALDYFVRGGGSLDIPDEWRNWLGVRFPRNWIVAPDTKELSKGQRRMSSAHRSKLQSTLVRVLTHLFQADLSLPEGEDLVDSLLLHAWGDLQTILKQTASGHILSLDELAFSTVEEAWICPITRRFLDTTIRGVTPYHPRTAQRQAVTCEKTSIPVYDAPFGKSSDFSERIRVGRSWLRNEQRVRRLRDEGLWPTVNDRVIEMAPYYVTAEHSAQQPSNLLNRYEKEFKEGRINLMSCSTTMELGIDIGGVQLVAMNNVPPHPANYLQRAGRAGRRRERRSAVVTLCKSNPHDLSVFSDTRWAFDTQLPPPVVSLTSGVIVQRHVNAMVLAQFLADLTRRNPKDLTKLTTGWFFEDIQTSPANRFFGWCESFVSKGSNSQLSQGITELIRQSAFDGYRTERLVHQCGEEMRRVCDRWLTEWQALQEQEEGLGDTLQSDPVMKAISFQKKRLAGEYLLRELATQGFLSSYGFPTSIATFDNMTVSAVKRLPRDEPGREDNRFRKHDLASRDLVTALREYAPGSKIVMDGLVYESSGITLNWHIPASEQGAQETQAIKFAWRCRRCGASGTSHTLIRASRCNACGSGVSGSDIEQFLEPAGFSVDFYQDPHNDVSSQSFVPVERPWLSARGEWVALPNPQLGRFRSTSEGSVYHHSRGINGRGYAICLRCGRAEPMSADGSLPTVFSADQQHKKLRSRKEDRICPGSQNRWAIKESIALGHQLRTDICEVQLTDSAGRWVSDRSTALTLAVALRDTLALLLGVQSTELGCDVRAAKTDDEQGCQSIFIFDRFSAGYSSSVTHLTNRLFREAARRLDCPKSCDSSCPHCVLDFDQRFQASALDRHAAKAVLTADWLDLLSLPVEYRYFGDDSRVETDGVIPSVMEASSHINVSITRLFAGGPPDSTDIATSNLRLLAYRIAALSRPVEVVFDQSLFAQLSEGDRLSLASLADHPYVSIATIPSLPTSEGAVVAVEVVNGRESRVWGCPDAMMVCPNDEWGTSANPIITGTTRSCSLDGLETLAVESIRSQQIQVGDREIEIHHELDGSIRDFGKRFWSFVTNQHDGIAELLSGSSTIVDEIDYSDRYLFTPVSIALVYRILSGLKNVVGSSRWVSPLISITTTNTRGSGVHEIYDTVYSDWEDSSLRDSAAKRVLASLGLKPKWVVSDRRNVQHSRSLAVRFSDGTALTLRFDQGVTYWRVLRTRTGSGRKSVRFDFTNPNIASHARAVREMNVFVEGGFLPTEIFVKIRSA